MSLLSGHQSHPWLMGRDWKHLLIRVMERSRKQNFKATCAHINLFTKYPIARICHVKDTGDCRFENTVVMSSCPVTSCVPCSCSLHISIPLLEFRNHAELWNAFMVRRGVSEQFTTRCDNSSLISEDLRLCQDLQWMQVTFSSPHPHQTHS
jgi:hypothetical protein